MQEDGSGPEVDVAVGAGGEEPGLGRVPHQVHHAEVVVHGVTPASRCKFNRLNTSTLLQNLTERINNMHFR